jgi:putative hemolysin
MDTGSSSQLLFDIGLVLVFILIAGIFVAAEIALISLRESQLRQLESTGKRGARVRRSRKEPKSLPCRRAGRSYLLWLPLCRARMQIASEPISFIPELEGWGVSHGLSTFISLIGLTTIIAYISLVFGELVPKRLALYRTEQIALAAAP